MGANNQAFLVLKLKTRTHADKCQISGKRRNLVQGNNRASPRDLIWPLQDANIATMFDHTFPDTEKREKNMMWSGVFLTTLRPGSNAELFMHRT